MPEEIKDEAATEEVVANPEAVAPDAEVKQAE